MLREYEYLAAYPYKRMYIKLVVTCQSKVLLFLSVEIAFVEHSRPGSDDQGGPLIGDGSSEVL